MMSNAAAEFVEREQQFEKELTELLNKYNMESICNTPDFIIANYLVHCLRAVENFSLKRERWYGVKCVPGQSITLPVNVEVKENEKVQD